MTTLSIDKLIMINKQLLQVKIGERIRECRESKGISQVELANLTGLEKSNLARLEKGRTNPTFLTLFKIALSIEISLSELVKIDERNLY